MRAMFPHTDARRAPLRTEIVLFRVAIGALVLLRLWLGSRLHVTPKVAPHDDLLFLDQAKALLDGQWLGKLDALTLIKGPFYPLFIAATQVAVIRLIAAEQWFYVASCGLFAVPLTPRVPSRWGRALAFAVLAFNPMSFATDPATRVIREGIYPALTLAVLACSIGLVARIHRSLAVRTAWALGLGFGLSAFWLTREEGIWIIPSLLALASIAVLQLRGWPAARAKTLLHAAVIPAFLLVASIDGVIVTNCRKYSVCATTEFSTDWFSSATRALYRVKPRQEKPYYLLPREARERAYAVSPAFRELRPYIEGPLGEEWIRYGPCDALRICDDLAGSWVVWSVRDAVEMAGYYRAGADAVASYYRRLASELEEACSTGRLECTAAGRSILPPWRADYTARFIPTLFRAGWFVASFTGFTPGSDSSRAPPRTLAVYASVREFDESWETPPVRSILSALGTAYSAVPLALLLAIGIYLLRCRIALKIRRDVPVLVATGSIALAILARLVLLTLIDVTSSPGISVLYAAPLYPLVLAFIVLALGQAWWARQSAHADLQGARDDHARPPLLLAGPKGPP